MPRSRTSHDAQKLDGRLFLTGNGARHGRLGHLSVPVVQRGWGNSLCGGPADACVPVRRATPRHKGEAWAVLLSEKENGRNQRGSTPSPCSDTDPFAGNTNWERGVDGTLRADVCRLGRDVPGRAAVCNLQPGCRRPNARRGRMTISVCARASKIS